MDRRPLARRLTAASSTDLHRLQIEASRAGVHVVGSLSRLGGRFRDVADIVAGRGHPSALADLGATLDEIEGGYVMAQQRLTHAAVTRSAAGHGPGGTAHDIDDDPTAIELF